MRESKVTYDDTRDVSIRIIEKLIELGYIEDNPNDHRFDVQDAIHDEINFLLDLDIDEKFEVYVRDSRSNQ